MTFKLIASFLGGVVDEKLGETPTLADATPLFAAKLAEHGDEAFEGHDVYVVGPENEIYVETGVAIFLGKAGPFVPIDDPRSCYHADYDIYHLPSAKEIAAVGMTEDSHVQATTDSGS